MTLKKTPTRTKPAEPKTKQKKAALPLMFGDINKSLNLNPNRLSYYLLMDEINYDSIRPVIEWILEANFAEERPDQLTLMLCSPGGLLSTAFSLIDIMRGSKIPISTVALGEIASAGTMIAMSGAKGRRFCTTRTSIMSHQYHGGFHGKHHELVTAFRDCELTHDRIMDLYKSCTSLDEDTILKVLLPPNDVYLTSQEALRYGIIDHIKDLG